MPIANYDLFYAHFGPFVASYVGRRADSGAVGDLVAEVFAVAWKRRVDVPEDALPWLYAVGRNVLGNHYRRTTDTYPAPPPNGRSSNAAAHR